MRIKRGIKERGGEEKRNEGDEERMKREMMIKEKTERRNE